MSVITSHLLCFLLGVLCSLGLMLWEHRIMRRRQRRVRVRRGRLVRMRRLPAPPPVPALPACPLHPRGFRLGVDKFVRGCSCTRLRPEEFS